MQKLHFLKISDIIILMKKFIKFFIIVFMFFITLSANAGELDICNLSNHVNTIQAESSQTPYIEGKESTPKYFVPTNQNTVTALFAQVKKDSKSNFTNYKNGISPENNQFSLLITYIYNKSFLLTENFRTKNFPLTEINRNAP